MHRIFSTLTIIAMTHTCCVQSIGDLLCNDERVAREEAAFAKKQQRCYMFGIGDNDENNANNGTAPHSIDGRYCGNISR